MATGGRHVLTLLLIDIFGNLEWFLLADLLRFIHTNLTWNILALLPWNILASLPRNISAFLSRDVLAGLAGDIGARLGRNLRTLGLGNINAHLTWDTLLNLVHHIFAHHGWQALASLHLDQGALSVYFLDTILSWYIFALLGSHVVALLRVVNLLTDFLCHGLALLFVDNRALSGRNFLAILFGPRVANLLIHLHALPPGDGLHHSIVLGVALPPAGSAALLIVDSLALLLVHRGADVVVLSGALLVVHSLTLVVVHGGALVVVLSVALLLVLSPALLLVLGLDNWLLDGAAQIVDNIITNVVSYVVTLLLGNVIVHSLVFGVAVLTVHGGGLSLGLLLDVRLLDFFAFSGRSCGALRLVIG